MSLQQLYVETGSIIHRLDPRVKFEWAVLVFILAVLFSNPYEMVILFVSVILVGLIARVSLRRLGTYFAFSLFLIFVSFLSWTVSTRGQHVIYVVPYISWVITTEGLRAGIASGFRIGTMVMTGILLSMTTSPSDMSVALERFHLPYSIGFSFVLATRFIPTLKAELDSILEAQMARGFEMEKVNIIRKARNYVPLLYPLISEAMRLAVDVAIALECRGFGALDNRTRLHNLNLTSIDKAVLIILPLIAGSALVLALLIW